MTTVLTAQDILGEALSRMDVTEEDIDVVYQYSQSLAEIVTNSIESSRYAHHLRDPDTVHKIENFFTMQI